LWRGRESGASDALEGGGLWFFYWVESRTNRNGGSKGRKRHNVAGGGRGREGDDFKIEGGGKGHVVTYMKGGGGKI